MKVNIRRALPKEAHVLSHIAFAAKAYWGYPDNWMEIWKPQLTFSAKYFEEIEAWAAELDNIPIAFYTLEEKSDKAWIENLWVLPDYIGKGIGKRLFVHALSCARELGYAKLQLVSDPNAVGFYVRLGMEEIDEHNYPIEGQPRFLPVMEIML